MASQSHLLSQFIDRAEGTSIAVIGEFILDEYIQGVVERISPEAPVPILKIQHESHRLGGAGNVVSNLSGLGAKPTCFGCIGTDPQSVLLEDGLASVGAVSRILKDPRIPAIVKTRLVSHHHHLYRVDRDPPDDFEYPSDLMDVLSKNLMGALPTFKNWILSDYGKGLFRSRHLQTFLSAANEKGCHVFVDPKSSDFRMYRGCFAITPNASEASRAVGFQVRDDTSADRAARAIHEMTGAKIVFLTRSEKGMSTFDVSTNKTIHSRAHAREVFDVTGAGDTVIATVSLAHSIGFTPFEAADIANVTASIVVGQFGAVPCRREDVQKSTEART